ncbi:hydroxymethylbilane synthase [bacterium]|nr:hydroxymethylbilane synthase [bacterium]
MQSHSIRIATRGSTLALWQANNVKAMLERAVPGTSVELVKISTGGDRDRNTPLSQMGGAGVFVKEVEQALLRNEADIAVHSAKDMPTQLEESLVLVGALPRGPLEDALVCRGNRRLNDLPEGAVIGTSSPRRAAQLLRVRPDLQIRDLRGNIETRLAKAERGEYDAILVARAALERLELQDHITEVLGISQFLPAPCQGIVAVQARRADEELCKLVADAGHAPTMALLWTERAFLATLQAGCSAAVAGVSRLNSDGAMGMTARVLSLDGKREVEGTHRISAVESPEKLGLELAADMINRGARALLAEAEEGPEQ